MKSFKSTHDDGIGSNHSRGVVVSPNRMFLGDCVRVLMSRLTDYNEVNLKSEIIKLAVAWQLVWKFESWYGKLESRRRDYISSTKKKLS